MEIEHIKNSIREIRGYKVMLDMDLAKIYEVETRVLKHASSRTTEIYTHVSTKNLQQIRSPFDDL